MKFYCGGLLVAHLLSCTIAQFIPTGVAALSPRDQLVQNPDNPPTFSDPKYRDLPCSFYTTRRGSACTQYDTMIQLKDLKELERYADSELKAADGTFKKPDVWILVKDDNYWVNPARNKWLRFRKEVAPLKDWFKNNNFDERKPPKTATTRKPPTSPGNNVNPGSKTTAAASIERISFKLWSKCPDADQCSNTVYSPMSISSMLTLLMLGQFIHLNNFDKTEVKSIEFLNSFPDTQEVMATLRVNCAHFWATRIGAVIPASNLLTDKSPIR